MTTQSVQESRRDAAVLEPLQVVGGKFRLERFIARGGMGSVWAATHLVLASPVAIKFLDRLRGGDPEEIELRVDRFRFEAQLSARLSSHTKHMVAVHDAGMHLGMPYLVMEFAPGQSLQDLLDKRGRLPVEWLVPVVEQVAEALDAASRQGIVHRDVKPGNILLVERGGGGPDAGQSSEEILPKDTLAKLADFGVAKPSEGSEIGLVAPKQTAEGLIVGSPAYMSPEQIAGVSAATGASDRWSLGVVMYEAITGWLPFRGESLTDFAIGITTRDPDPPSSVVETLSPAIDAFFVRALAKRPEDRFPTSMAMTQAFREAVEAPAAVSRQKPKGWLWLVGAASLLLVLSAAWLTSSRARDPEPTPAAASVTASDAPTTPAAVVAPAVSPPSAPLAPAASTTPPAAAGPTAAASTTTAPRPPRPAAPRSTSAPAAAPPGPPASTARHLDPSEVH